MLYKNVSSNREAIHQMTRVIPHVAMATGDMIMMIGREEAKLKRMTKICMKDQASPEDYADLFGAEQLRSLKHADTYIDDVKKSGTDIISRPVLHHSMT